MITSFADEGSEDIFNGVDSKEARRSLPVVLHDLARLRLDRLNAAHEIRDLRSPPGMRLEKLRGDRKGQWSIRINQQYRICFHWTEVGAERVEVTDYH